MVRRWVLTLGLLMWALGVGNTARAQGASGDRIALVIGNAAYADNPLPNPKNDAKAVAELLSRAGFVVDVRTDTSRAELLQAITRFGQNLREPKVRLALFYYAGHGFQQDWRNYLVPVDAKVQLAADVPAQTVDVSELLRQMNSARGRNYLVILDACRDDPFAGSYRPALKGLSQFDAPVGSLLAYATAPGQTAFDGSRGGNGLYTKHLVRELGVADSSVEDALKRVRLNVRLESRGRQIPWELASLEETVFLFPQAQAQRKLSDAEREARFERELKDWLQVRQGTDILQLAAFIRNFPSGNTSELAQSRLSRLLAAEIEQAARPIPAAPTTTLAAPAPAAPAQVPPTPHFSGLAEHRRDYRVGDVFETRTVERVGGKARSQTLRVTAVDAGADRVEFNQGEYVSDLMGNILANPKGLMSTPRQFYPAELVVGRKWRTEFKQARPSGLTYAFAYDLRVAAKETVTVPAGTFEAFRIEATGFNVGLSAYIKRTIWVAPGVDADIAHAVYLRQRNGFVELDERQELVAYPKR